MKKKVIGYSLPIGMSPKAVTDKIHELRYATGASWVDVNTVGRRVNLVLYFGEMDRNIPYALPDNLADYKLPIPIGYDMDNKLIMLDMGGDAHPFIFVAGSPGTGKSVAIKGFINCIIEHNKALGRQNTRFVLIDLKMGVELGRWFGDKENTWLSAKDPTQPHLKHSLTMLLDEIKKRMTLFEDEGVVDLPGYNAKHPEKPKNYIMLVIDEYAEIRMAENGTDHENLLKSILQMGRAAGVRCIAATQRLSWDSVSTTVKAVFSDRLVFSVTSALNSKIALDCAGAEEIPSDIPGRALFLSGSKLTTVQVMNYH